MPSREFRRATRRKSEHDETVVEKRRERHPIIYAFSVVILLVIVVTFIGGPGVSRAARGGRRIVFGAYKGKPIEYYPGNYLSERKDLIADQLRKGSTDNQKDLESQAYQVWRTAFDQTVLHTAVLLETERAGMWISEDRVDQALIKSGPYLVDGVFSEERYRATSTADRYATRKLFREQLLHEQYLRDVFLTPMVSEQEKSFFGSMVQQQRRFNFVSFSFASYPQERVRSFAEQNRDRFRRIKLSSILVKTSERDAQEVRRKLTDRTSSFEELARTHSKDAYAEKGGDMGWRYFFDLEADFDKPEAVEKVFALQEGEISPVLHNKYGWAIYRCDSPSLNIDLENPEALQEVRNYVMRYEKGMVEDYTVQQADSFRARVRDVGFLGATLERGSRVAVTEFFPINFQGFYFMAPVRSATQGFDLSAAASSEDFFVKAFALPPKGVSEPILLDDQVIVLELAEVRQAPKSEMDILSDYVNYYAQQSLEQDLQNTLLDPQNIQDDFNSTFYQHIFVSR
jgi:peptidyl-prolyl cis-trans isomerase D